MTGGGTEVWVVDDDRSMRWVLGRALEQAGIGVRAFGGGEDMLAALARSRPDVLLCDVRMPGTDGFQVLERVAAEHPTLPVVVMTAYSDLDTTVAAYQGGAFDYLPKPFDLDEAIAVVRRAVTHAREAREAGAGPRRPEGGQIIGSAPAMQEVFRAIGRLSRSSVTVLVTGESGTGKELVARALHQHSPRSHGPFIALNTAAIPSELLESELFGHERGAFTGAQHRRIGRFEQADGGTLFLDEIGDMPAELQTRLLRVLADGELYRVGGHDSIRVDVRIIAATHQDLESRVREGSFREDLYHRLNVIRVHVPALRDRRQDIPELASHFLGAAAVELGVEPKVLTREALRLLCAAPWPGNVRQLENACRWITVMAPGSTVGPGDLPPELRACRSPAPQGEGWETALVRWASEAFAVGQDRLLEEALPRFERALIRTALRQTGGRKQEAARLLGWGRNTLTRKLREHAPELGIELEEREGEGEEP